jgi:hypothetical protein
MHAFSNGVLRSVEGPEGLSTLAKLAFTSFVLFA